MQREIVEQVVLLNNWLREHLLTPSKGKATHPQQCCSHYAAPTLFLSERLV